MEKKWKQLWRNTNNKIHGEKMETTMEHKRKTMDKMEQTMDKKWKTRLKKWKTYGENMEKTIKHKCNKTW